MAHPGTLHKYTNRHVAFEHSLPSPSSTPPTPQNTVLFIGGLTDGLLTVPYPTHLATSLPPSWSLAEVLLSSSYKGWTTGNLARDARELQSCVTYFRSLRPSGKIVLVGHSTGCQDIIEYLVGAGAKKREGVEGAILQGGVSDREGVWDMCVSHGSTADYEALVRRAKELIDAGKGKEMMPVEGNPAAKAFGSPATAYRTHSLLAHGGDDDFFSSDLEDKQLQKTFGKIPKQTAVCFLVGEKDPYIPSSVDKDALLRRWTSVIRDAGGTVDEVHSGVVSGASHDFKGCGEEVMADLVGRVNGFLGTLGDRAAEESSTAGGSGESRL